MMFNAQKTHLFALALTDGKQLGKLDAEGMVPNVTPYNGGFYVQALATGSSSSLLVVALVEQNLGQKTDAVVIRIGRRHRSPSESPVLVGR